VSVDIKDSNVIRPTWEADKGIPETPPPLDYLVRVAARCLFGIPDQWALIGSAWNDEQPGLGVR
jgi:hypothetical protein